MKKIISLFTLVVFAISTPLVAQTYQLSPQFAKKFAVLENLHHDTVETDYHTRTVKVDLAASRKIIQAAFDCLKNVETEIDYIALYEKELGFGEILTDISIDTNYKKEATNLRSFLGKYTVKLYSHRFLQQEARFVNEELSRISIEYDTVYWTGRNIIGSFRHKINEYTPVELYWICDIGIDIFDTIEASDEEARLAREKMQATKFPPLVDMAKMLKE